MDIKFSKVKYFVTSRFKYMLTGYALHTDYYYFETVNKVYVHVCTFK